MPPPSRPGQAGDSAAPDRLDPQLAWAGRIQRPTPRPELPWLPWALRRRPCGHRPDRWSSGAFGGDGEQDDTGAGEGACGAGAAATQASSCVQTMTGLAQDLSGCD